MRLRPAVLACALAGVLAAGCADPATHPRPPSRPDVQGESPATALAAAPARTLQAGTARLWFEVRMSGPGKVLAQALSSIRGDGMIDLRANRARVDTRVGDATTAGVLGHAVITTIYDNGVEYLNLPLSFGFGGPGMGTAPARPWVKVDLRKALGSAGAKLPLGGPASLGGDPTRGLDALRGARGITDLGADTVRGVPTHHYRATIDLRTMVQAVMPASRARDRQLAALGRAGATRMRIEAWIDGQGRARRLRWTMPLADLAAPGGAPAQAGDAARGLAGMAMVSTVEYYDFGLPVHIQLPPPSQVADASDLAAGGGLGG